MPAVKATGHRLVALAWNGIGKPRRESLNTATCRCGWTGTGPARRDAMAAYTQHQREQGKGKA